MLPQVDPQADFDKDVDARSEQLFRTHLEFIHRRTDRLFGYVLLAQWLTGIAVALVVSPRTWSGPMSQTHVHVWAAVLLGGAIAAVPAFLVWKAPGRTVTRHAVAIGQTLTSALLIHLTGGRIETHFHVFGSLALLACYRDVRVLATSTAIVVLDHWLRGLFWPESVYGVLTVNGWRFLEHAGWVVLEVVSLAVTVRQSLREMHHIAQQRAYLEATNILVEAEVRRRTDELHITMEELGASNRELASANTELEDKNRELDQFTYVASHDLQEPVRKLISFSQLLKEDLGDQLDERAKTDLSFIVDAAYRMRQLIQDLLVLSRAGRTEIKAEQIALDDCVDRALQSLQLRIEETGAVIQRDPLPEVRGEATMLTQVYLNLIGNSLKFVDKQTPQIRLTAERDGDYWVLGVQDNGIGLAPDQSERVFQPFQRLHHRDEFPGTGIGLAICKKAIQRHQGRIFVEGQPGRGAHFQFTLPAQSGPFGKHADSTPSDAPLETTAAC